MKIFHFMVSIVFAVLFLCGTQPALSQWSHDPNANTPVCTAVGYQYPPVMVSDGSGGSIFAWTDYRSDTLHIYAQRFSKEGVALWTLDGAQITNAPNGQTTPAMVSDDSGGAIITWPDIRSGSDYDIYAQRINGAGIPQWTANGVPICTAPTYQLNAICVTDGSGGAIIAWIDQRNGTQDIYAQRVNKAGVVQWTPNGVPICTAANNQSSPTMVSDGSGGAIISWSDSRSGTNVDIYGQRINTAGTVQWAANGVPICAAANDQIFPACASDSAGGAIVVWQDLRSSSAYHIYAQRINISGVVQWTTDGIPLCQAANSEGNPTITSDGAGGAIITWQDYRSGSNYDIYAQRVSASGATQWAQDGVAVCTAGNSQQYPVIATDGSGGALITWQDLRNGSDYDIYAQRLSNLGIPLWTSSGTPVSTAAGHQQSVTILGDGTGAATIAWTDVRSGIFDIYADRIDNIGYLGYNNPQISFVKDVPADQGGKVTVAFNGSSYDQYPYDLVYSYSIWRGISTPANVPSMSSGVFKNSAGKTYRKISSATGTTYWEQVGSITSHYFQNYSFTAPTLNDSDPTGTHSASFLVSAQTWYTDVFWDSNIDSGYSVDNIPPGAVQTVVAQLQGGSSVLVHWSADVTDLDVGYYEVHRSTTAGFTPTPSTQIAQTTDTSYVDASPVNGVANYYRILTVDKHGNVGPPSPQAAAGSQSTQLFGQDDKWNLISVPLVVNNFSKTSLFPTAVSNATAYEGNYVIKSTLANGLGYWLRFSGAQNVSLTGYLINTDTVSVTAGWNLIGSISSPVSVSTITSLPGGIVTSQFFGYNGGYAVSSTIEPGKGYWVKVNQDGQLVLASSGQSVAGRIVINTSSEMPPPPPDDGSTNLVSGIPDRFSLEQNFPNPFNPTTEVRYQLAEARWVTMKIYNMLGQEIATPVNEYQDAGYKIVEINMATLPSGIYMYKITAGSFSDMKKMILIK